ncbi:ABC transporter permease [Amycolatopsis sp. FDAARGOS 1241]|uniref:ABC transporter permease n=1 Tax=Amycolatopsis sp. FDAARGOS 1241 TaxID=2778070 RepID=UPI001EF20A5E|nr:ABC transporter permease [Amycolatopsis sp. FDAARGOS 1241]
MEERCEPNSLPAAGSSPRRSAAPRCWAPLPCSPRAAVPPSRPPHRPGRRDEALLGPWLGPVLTGYSTTDFAGKPYKPDGLAGTDGLGRDVLTRFLAGGTTLLLYAVLATAPGIVLGALLGMVADYGGGRLDSLLMRGNDVLLSFPQLVIALLAIAVIGPQGWLLVLVIGLTHAPRTARVARQATVAVRGEDYIKAAEMYAVPRSRVLLREILPNITGRLMVELGLRLTYSIGYIASLSFLGLGIQPPAADWGLMINENRIALVVQPWGVLLPVIAIALLAVGTNLVADSLASAAAGHTRETAGVQS